MHVHRGLALSVHGTCVVGSASQLSVGRHAFARDLTTISIPGAIRCRNNPRVCKVLAFDRQIGSRLKNRRGSCTGVLASDGHILYLSGPSRLRADLTEHPE